MTATASSINHGACRLLSRKTKMQYSAPYGVFSCASALENRVFDEAFSRTGYGVSPYTPCAVCVMCTFDDTLLSAKFCSRLTTQRVSH